jgi:hypothetical protein
MIEEFGKVPLGRAEPRDKDAARNAAGAGHDPPSYDPDPGLSVLREPDRGRPVGYGDFPPHPRGEPR